MSNLLSAPPKGRSVFRLTKLVTSPYWAWMVLVCMAGFVVGMGLYTFSYAEGFSYAADDPDACVNCHVMRAVYERYSHGSHKSVATCNDCHVPHSPLGKYATKALSGYHHSSAFTTGNFDEPIRIKESSRTIVRENCLRCHGDLTEPTNQHTYGPADCLRCHASTGHGF